MAALDMGPTLLKRNFGPAFGVGWLAAAQTICKRSGPKQCARLQSRVLAELKTTFACRYTREISLAEALHLDEIAVYSQRATAGKYLINPSRNLN